MTIINITATPEVGALQLSLADVEPITAITRSDANGVAPVRTLPGVLPWTPTLVEDLRNLSRTATTDINFNVTRCTKSGAQNSSYTRVTADGSGGSTYIYYNGCLGSTGVLTGMIPVMPGDQLAANITLRNPNAVAMQARITLVFYDAAGAGISGTVTGNMATMAAGTSNTVSVAGTTPAGAAAARPIVYFYESTGGLPTAGLMLDYKYLTVFKGASALANERTTFHGSYADTDVYDYSWDGTADASESVRKVLASPLLLTDYEAASGAVTYYAATATDTSTAATSWALAGPWLFVPVMPNYSAQLQTVLDYSASANSLGTIHELLGRTDPVAVMRGMGSRAGSLSLWCKSFSDAATVVEAVKRGQVLMLRQPEHAGMDMYFAATGYNIKPLTTEGAATVWAVDVGYRQVARPLAALAGSLGWTFAALAAAYPTFATLPGKYTSFQTLRINEVKP